MYFSLYSHFPSSFFGSFFSLRCSGTNACGNCDGWNNIDGAFNLDGERGDPNIGLFGGGVEKNSGSYNVWKGDLGSGCLNLVYGGKGGLVYEGMRFSGCLNLVYERSHGFGGCLRDGGRCCCWDNSGFDDSISCESLRLSTNVFVSDNGSPVDGGCPSGGDGSGCSISGGEGGRYAGSS